MDLFLNDQFLIPLLSTIGASLTIIIGQQIFAFCKRQKQKVFCVNYILDVSYRMLFSNLTILEKTINPHIEATKRIIGGDGALLQTMFLADEFDVLTNKKIDVDKLPEDYKLLIGFDDMKVLQTINTFISFNSDSSDKDALNEFVRQNLKSELNFMAQPIKNRNDILSVYWDYLEKNKRNIDRINGFICNMILPIMRSYLSEFQFKLFSKRSAKDSYNQILHLMEQHIGNIPTLKNMADVLDQGIQKVL